MLVAVSALYLLAVIEYKVYFIFDGFFFLFLFSVDLINFTIRDVPSYSLI